ncbi:uncharacterized protein [Argopecten irradians]|uniref:uncharacterized protein n=1 Tax=Argopecten irradians TaxID=31199 RepID=UPI00371F96CE
MKGASNHLTRIFVEAYDVLYTYLMGDSRKNELYIAKYIDFFLSQFEYKEGQIGLNAAHMVMELIRDNRKIVDRISHEHIDKFVELLRRDKVCHLMFVVGPRLSSEAPPNYAQAKLDFAIL